MRKTICLLLTAVLLLGGLSGCSSDNGDEREKVTVAFWSDQLTEQYGKFLQERFPEVDFTFYVSTNSADFYRFKN